MASPTKIIAAMKRKLDHSRRIAYASQTVRRRFGNDPNYRPDLVPDGFAPHPAAEADDTALLERIVAAYRAAKMDQKNVGEAFNVGEGWEAVYRHFLGPVMQALSDGDIPRLQAMYRNFFRDRCSSGVLGPPVDVPKMYFGETIQPKDRDYYLCDSLHRYYLWRERTQQAFSAEALATPMIGNPYGYMVDGTFVRQGAEYQHYYARTISQLLGSGDSRVVAELGGGYGGLAFFLLRDFPGVTFVDLDLPEMLALASYYIMRTHPELPVVLYGEAEFPGQLLSRPGAVMMPSFQIEKMLPGSVDLSFNSYSLTEMPPATIEVYLKEIARVTGRYFMHLNLGDAERAGIDQTASALGQLRTVPGSDKFGMEKRGFRLVDRKLAGWMHGVNPESDETEYLYEKA